jgi:protein-S-isoprenylcysteine O-methyltransferase Ste14
MRVAREHAWSMARPVFMGVFALFMLFSVGVAKDVPPAHFWLISLMTGMLFASVTWFYIYMIKGLNVINLILEVDHVEETQGITGGQYDVVRHRNPPTPSSSAV